MAELIPARLFDEDGGVESTLWSLLESTPSDGASAQGQPQAQASIDLYVPLTALGKQLQARVNYQDDYAEENTAFSDTTEAVRANVPGAPDSLQATAGHRQVRLTWNAAWGRGAAVDSYRVRLDTGSWTTVPGGGAARETTVTGLDNGTSYTFGVRAHNRVGAGAADTVSAEPVNRKPVCTGPATKSLAENGSKAIETYTCTDDPGDAITWILKGAQASSFELAALSPAQATKRNLHLGSVPNFEARSSYRVSVVGRDSGGLSDTVKVTVTITDVNERPNVSGSTTVSVPERTQPVATYTGADPDAGDAAGLTWSLDSTHAALFELKTITSQPTKRKVQFKSVPHFTRSNPGANTKVVAVVVKDSSDLSDRETVTVTIADVDDPGLVTLTPSSPRVGQTVTAILTDSDGGIADTSWAWEPDHSSEGASASGLPGVQRRSEREVVEADVGQRIRATVGYRDNHGSGKSATKFTNAVSAIPPGRPSLRVSAGDGRATLSWTPPTTNGGAAIDRYQVFRSPSGSWSTVPGGGGARDTTMTGLTNGTSYTFYVRARNSAGYGSADSEKARPRGRPGAPKNLEAQRGSRRATLTWDAADSNGSWIDRYEYKVLPGGTSWSTVSGGHGARSKLVTNLTNGTAYTFYVRAENDVGKGAPASDTVTPAGPPGYPDSLATDRQGGNGFMELSWAAAPDNGSPVLHYYYRYKKTSDTNWRGWYRRFGGGAARSKTWSNFDDGATYTFQLRARNDVGYGPVAQISAQPMGAGGTSQPAQSQGESAEEPDDERMPEGEVPEPGEDEVLVVDAEPGETAKPVAAVGPARGRPESLAVTTAPNPFNASTALGVHLPEPARVTLTVYNITGQVVAVVVDQELAAGVHRREWDGRGQHGRAAASGLYLYRLVAGPQVRSGKLALIR